MTDGEWKYLYGKRHQVINFTSKEDYERGLKVLGRNTDFIIIVSEEDCDELRRAGIKFVAGAGKDWLP